MAKRERKEVLTPPSAAEAEDVMAQYASADARIEQLQAKMDEEFTRIREKYADEIQEKLSVKETASQKLQLFAETNREAFSKRRSLDMAHGKLGFRTGTPKLKPLKGFTWAAVTNLLKDKMPDFVRTKDEPNKELLLESRDKKHIADRFEEIGIEVVQDETFFIELKKEENAKSA